MKNESNLINTIKVVVLALVLAVGVQYVAAQSAPSWSAPNGTPPNNDTYSPLNVSLTGQIKDGGLTLGFSPSTVNSLVVPNGKVTIGTNEPTSGSEKLDIVGKIKATALQILPATAPTVGYVLTAADTSGNAVWQAAPSGGGSGMTCTSGGTCTTGKVAKFGSPTTVRDSVITETNNNVGIGGAAHATYKLQVTGDVNVPTGNCYRVNGTCITSGGGGNVTVTSGTTNYLPKWTGATTLSGTSNIFDNGINVGIGTNAPTTKLDVNGTFRMRLGSGTANQVLKSADTGGSAVWATPSISYTSCSTVQISAGGTQSQTLAGGVASGQWVCGTKVLRDLSSNGGDLGDNDYALCCDIGISLQ